MQPTKDNINCDYAYIQHTLFGNEVDVVYVRKEAIKVLGVIKLKNG